MNLPNTQLSRKTPCPCGSGRKYKHCCGASARAPSVDSLLREARNRLQAGDLAAALEAGRQVLAIDPARVGAMVVIALALRLCGRRDAALDWLRRAEALAPDDADVLNNLGCVLLEAGDPAGAMVRHYRALQASPDSPEAHFNLGNALRDYGRPEEALASYERALTLQPRFPAALVNCGNVLRGCQRHAEAIELYKLAIECAPELADAWNNLGTALTEQGHREAAVIAYEEALRLAPESAIAHYNLANLCKDDGENERLAALLERAIELDPGLAEAHLNLGSLRKVQGRIGDALVCYSRAVAARPGWAAAHSNLLFTLAMTDDIAAGDKFELHRDWARRHADGLPRHAHANDRDPARRLRVGYVSPDFRNHACAFFLEPLLREHDRATVEVHAYAEVAQPDAVTARLRGLVDVWHDTVGLSDEALAARIHADGIDVLVDLAGHTAGGRLLAFARKPAPVQLCWLGYPATTGLESMDWRLTDAVAEPSGPADHLYTERLFRLPHSLWCYQAPEHMRSEVSPLPAAARGYVTFGSLNSYTKVGPRVVELWAEVLHAVPGSRIKLITVPDGEAQVELWARFEALGIPRSRVELHGRLGREAYIAVFGDIDIALDPFPCNGGTTTCDSLWMGLPVVALRGGSFLSRAALSVLTAAGCAEWAADDAAAYVETCRALAADLPALAATRAGLRARVAASPLTDAPGFARDVEAAYRDMWRQWCAEEAR
jgi:protein O-GlcNAc transferase